MSTPLERLNPKATLGTIADALDKEQSALSKDNEREPYWPKLWQRYDAAFGHRPDYRLWRLRLKLLMLPPDASTWGKPAELVLAALQQTESSNIQWSAIAVVAYLIDHAGNRDREETNSLLTAEVIARVATLEPVRGGELKCGVIRERILTATSTPSSHEDLLLAAAEPLDSAERFLEVLDADWRQGQPRLEFGNRNVAPFHDAELQGFIASILDKKLKEHFLQVNKIAETGAAFSDEIEAILSRAEIVARFAWYVSRNSARGLALSMAGTDDPLKARIGKAKLLTISESRAATALRNLYFASSNRADSELSHLRSVTIAHLAVCMDAAGTASSFVLHQAWRITQAGLRITLTHSDPLNKEHVRHARKPRLSTPFWTRLIHERSTLREWKDLDARFYIWQCWVDELAPEDAKPGDYHAIDVLRHLAHAAEKRQLSDPPTLRSAFALAQRYACTAWAAKLLGALGAHTTQKDLLDFAHHLKRAQQTLPLGRDHDEHREWQDRLRAAWSTLAPGQNLVIADALVLHEVLLGRSLQLLRKIEPAAAKTIALRHNGLLPDSALPTAIVIEPAVVNSAPTMLDEESLFPFLQAHRSHALGAPMCCSLVQIGEDRFHLLAAAIAGDGHPVWFSGAHNFTGILEHVQEMRRCPRDWLVENSDGTTGLEIDWGEGLPQLMRRLAALARAWRIQPEWLMLAVEPSLASLPWRHLIPEADRRDAQQAEASLASLPWQHLTQRFWPGRKKPLTTLVPSLGWAALTSAELRQHPPNFYLRLSSEADHLRQQHGLPDLQTLRGQIIKAERDGSWALRSTVIITGHGTVSQSEIPAVDANGIVRVEDWIDYSDSRILILHSCFGGYSAPRHLGDLGGVPNLTLGGQTRLLCAPVAEVPIEAALCLSQKHLAPDGPREFGERYRAALAENPIVALYNLYGLPGEWVGY